MHYRKLYEIHLGYKLSSDFEVHHIDHVRTNNFMNNLVGIPRVLHRKYHAACSRVNMSYDRFKESERHMSFYKNHSDDDDDDGSVSQKQMAKSFYYGDKEDYHRHIRERDELIILILQYKKDQNLKKSIPSISA